MNNVYIVNVRRTLSCLIAVFAIILTLFAAPVLAAEQSAMGYLKTAVDPGRAGVFVNGNYLGPAANFRVDRTYALPAGEHQVTLAEPRFENYTTTVQIRPGETTTLTYHLKEVTTANPPFGILKTIGEDKFAAVFVNGAYMGHVDEFNNFAQGLLLNPGEYIVKIVSPGGDKIREEKIQIRTNQVTVVKAGQGG